jgi:hypothetical protein
VKIGLRLGTIVLIGACAAGCAAAGYQPSALEKKLVAAGVKPAAAKCAIQGMTERFGSDILSVRVAPSAQEINAQRVILRRCEVKLRPKS